MGSNLSVGVIFSIPNNSGRTDRMGLDTPIEDQYQDSARISLEATAVFLKPEVRINTGALFER
jgi:hypothetical protein